MKEGRGRKGVLGAGMLESDLGGRDGVGDQEVEKMGGCSQRQPDPVRMHLNTDPLESEPSQAYGVKVCHHSIHSTRSRKFG